MIASFLQSIVGHAVSNALRALVVILLAPLILMGCASEVLRSPVSMLPERISGGQVIEIGQLTTLTFSTGYQRSLLTGSRWEHVGSVPAGSVYRPIGTVFTIEGANMHEAFLVIRDAQVVGFYLPGENAFSVLEPAVPIQFKQTK